MKKVSVKEIVNKVLRSDLLKDIYVESLEERKATLVGTIQGFDEHRVRLVFDDSATLNLTTRGKVEDEKGETHFVEVITSVEGIDDVRQNLEIMKKILDFAVKEALLKNA